MVAADHSVYIIVSGGEKTTHRYLTSRIALRRLIWKLPVFD